MGATYQTPTSAAAIADLPRPARKPRRPDNFSIEHERSHLSFRSTPVRPNVSAGCRSRCMMRWWLPGFVEC